MLRWGDAGWAMQASSAYAAFDEGQTEEGWANAVWALTELRGVHDRLLHAATRHRLEDPVSSVLVHSAEWAWRGRRSSLGRDVAPPLRRLRAGLAVQDLAAARRVGA